MSAEDPQLTLFSLPPTNEYVLEVRKHEGDLAQVVGTFPLQEDHGIKVGDELEVQGLLIVKGFGWMDGKNTLIAYSRDVVLNRAPAAEFVETSVVYAPPPAPAED